MKKLLQVRRAAFLFSIALVLVAGGARADFVNFETPQVHPVDMSPDGKFLAVCNTADNRIEIFDVRFGNPLPLRSIPVGYDPVSVRFRSNSEAWVVNQISDSVSVVDVVTGTVVDTLLTLDEPADVVFAGATQKAYVSCSQADTIQVFNPANLALAPTNIPIMGEDPRALAVSPDGLTVYAAIFESGNKSTVLGGGLDGSGGALAFPPNVVEDPAGPYGGTNPPPNDGAGFTPAMAGGLPTAPEVGLIVKKDAMNLWKDDNGGDWTALVSGASAGLSGRPVGWDVLDNDVAIIDTATGAATYAGGMMNIVMAISVHPVGGDVVVVGTDATNEIRFEPNINGTFLRVLFGAFDPTTPAAVLVGDLNGHLTYATSTVAQTERDKSIGDPRGIAWNAAGTRAYITGMGSNNVVVYDETGARAGLSDTIEVGEGPTGLAIDEVNRRIYVLNRFGGSLSVVDLDSEVELKKVSFFDPTPAAIKTGRKHLYDTHLNSGLGQVACASCHVDSRMDRLAWDLGDPSGGLIDIIAATQPGAATAGPDEIVINRGGDVSLFNTGMDTSYHPMKGPMTTQTLQDIIGKEPHHWRGDRQGIEQFRPAFMFLQGDDTQPTPAETQEFEDYLATIHFPPNPFRNLDNTLPTNLPLPGQYANGRFTLAPGAPLPNGDAQRALTTVYRPAIRQIDGLACISCHALPIGIGSNTLETTGNILAPNFETIPSGPKGELHHAVVSVDGSTQRAIKVPQLRNMYDKVGFVALPDPSNGGAPHVSRAGFGHLHDGSVDSLSRFFEEPAFDFNTDQEIADMVALMLSFAGSEFDDPVYSYSPDALEPPGTFSLDAHAGVGQQVTLTSNAMAGADFVRFGALLAQGDTAAVDVVVKAVVGGVPRGWMYEGLDSFQIDMGGVSETKTSLVNRASAATPVTVTVVPANCGQRFGIDRDGDGLFDFDEIRDLFPALPGHQNPFSPTMEDSSGDNGALGPDGTPDGQNDFDNDGMLNEDELANGTNPADNLATATPVETTMTENMDGSVTLGWIAAPGGVYQVQYTDSLATWADSPTGGFIAPAGGGLLEWTDGGAPATASHPSSVDGRYYRVVRIF